jgi:hypothetical protein
MTGGTPQRSSATERPAAWRVSDSRLGRRTNHRARIRWGRVAILLVVMAALGAILGDLLPARSPSTGSSAPAAAASAGVDRREDRGAHHGTLGEADGAVPDGTSVFDDEVPGVDRLDPALLSAVRQAASDAADDGVRFVVDSGWRSPAYQEQLLREAVAQYGSLAEASRWVAGPTTSAHVSGEAIDIGPVDAASWLSEHGAAYGLCQVYANEAWHYELRPNAAAQGCPPTYADATQDPRMWG